MKLTKREYNNNTSTQINKQHNKQTKEETKMRNLCNICKNFWKRGILGTRTPVCQTYLPTYTNTNSFFCAISCRNFIVEINPFEIPFFVASVRVKRIRNFRELGSVLSGYAAAVLPWHALNNTFVLSLLFVHIWKQKSFLMVKKCPELFHDKIK